MEMPVIDKKQLSDDYRRVEQAILYLENNAHRQPSLKEIAASVSLSEYHFQRLFTRWVGISPKRFLQFLTKERAKQMLERSENLLDVTYETGLSSPGRLHDLFVACEAVTPGEYKAQGEGLTIQYGFHYTPFGECLLFCTHAHLDQLLDCRDPLGMRRYERIVMQRVLGSLDVSRGKRVGRVFEAELGDILRCHAQKARLGHAEEAVNVCRVS